jgi:hypothetical protein
MQQLPTPVSTLPPWFTIEAGETPHLSTRETVHNHHIYVKFIIALKLHTDFIRPEKG